MKSSISLLLLLLGWFFTQAQPILSPTASFIEVTGEGKLAVVPDEIYLSIEITETSLTNAELTLPEMEARMIETIRSHGIEIDNISLADVSRELVKINKRKSQIATSQEYILKLPGVAKTNELVQAMAEIGIVNIVISRVDHSQIEQLKQETQIKALQSAQQKAQYLCEAMDKKVGDPLFVVEVDVHTSYADLSVRGNRDRGTVYYIDGVKVRGKPLSELAFQKIQLEHKILARFEIVEPD